MIHRFFSFFSFTRSLVAISLLGLASATSAQQAITEGKDYRVIRPAQPLESPASKIEVIEFFWYGCPHCNSLEPALDSWIKRQGADVTVRRIPVAFNDKLVPHQRLYYALEALGKESELRAKVFQAIHRDRNPLNTQDLMAEFAARNGIDRKAFIDTYNSFAVQSRTRRAAQIAENYRVDGVPMMAVQGTFVIPNSPNILNHVDALVSRVRSQPGKS